ncbi:P-loop NTPase family protein [Micromonospora tarensis]|uniref:Topology modulation protein n=1 Tax=Micromonospora tarensis TaxID=2806100 RepID=A0ABS1YHW7_9ACTN|nr:topology modulation protein [Micromonospora tarensis]MBM0277001.1 topology modulation protein [Micromonospora tarensis]
MNRIAIIGCGGAGKTVLANRLAALLDLPVINLDAIYYDGNWKEKTAVEFAAIQRGVVAADRWIIDGNHASTLYIRVHRADSVIFLDLPAWTCLWGIVQRRWRYRGGQHPDGVYDRITMSFIRYIIGYRKKMRPRIAAVIREHGQHAQYVTLTSRRQARRFLGSIGTN